MNGLMRAVESLWQVVTDGSRIRYYSELLYGNAEWAFYTSITGGTAGFPVPELGGSFFCFWRCLCIFCQCDGVDIKFN